MQSKQYEDALKERLVSLAREDPEACAKVLADCGSVPGELEKEGDGAEGGAAKDDHEALTDLVMDLFSKSLLPAIVFQLDSVRCQQMFEGMLMSLERREAEKHPDYKAGLLEKEKAAAKELKKKPRAAKKNEDADDIMEAQQFARRRGDVCGRRRAASDFTLAPVGRSIGPVEARDHQAALADDLPKDGEQMHLIRALRRGIGCYIEGLPTAYLRIVQSAAQAGKLGVVLSDELLAYGVNMPFRSAVFSGDCGPNWLTPLLHQQMAGRAGRRGLDRLANLVYHGFSAARLK